MQFYFINLVRIHNDVAKKGSVFFFSLTKTVLGDYIVGLRGESRTVEGWLVLELTYLA